jgi:hypothetical protein
MGCTTSIVVGHILLASNLGLGKEGETLTASIFICGTRLEREDVGLAVLCFQEKLA